MSQASRWLSVDRKSSDYAVIPVVREIANILVLSVSGGNIAMENASSHTDTIPYAAGMMIIVQTKISTTFPQCCKTVYNQSTFFRNSKSMLGHIDKLHHVSTVPLNFEPMLAVSNTVLVV